MCEINETCEEGDEDCNNAREEDHGAEPEVAAASIPPFVIGIVVGFVILLVVAFIVYFAVCRGKKTGSAPISSGGDRATKKTRNVIV